MEQCGAKCITSRQAGDKPLPVTYDIIQNGRGGFAKSRVTSSVNVVASANYSKMYYC